MSPTLLVVDDDNRLRQLLAEYLTQNEFQVLTAASTEEATNILEHHLIDLMVLDVMMPGESGFNFTLKLRQQSSTLPIILLTAMGEAQDRITGLENGADDYLPKPFEPKELVLRIRRILERVRAASVPTFGRSLSKDTIVLGECVFNLSQRRLTKGDATVILTSTEIDLLRVLALSAHTPVSRYDLCEKMLDTTVSPRTIDVQITRLRRKIEPDPKTPRYIQTVRHQGYMLVPDHPPSPAFSTET
jgi:two-component system phosphate regulon response regulator OmpR